MRIFAATAETRTRPHANGFTLVELMVVLAIMALAATAVVLTIPGEERSVRSEADRLAARLAAARDVAVIEGRSVAVHFAPSGYGFERRVSGEWQPLPGRAFEQRSWPGDVRFVAGNGQGAARIHNRAAYHAVQVFLPCNSGQHLAGNSVTDIAFEYFGADFF